MIDFGPSPFDVKLVAFRIPIRVHWSFWLSMILLGWNPNHPDFVFVWVVCGFFSILVHELGHGLTAEAFGWPSQILMYLGGGLCYSERFQNATPWRNLVVSIMGPVAGFLLYLAIRAAVLAILSFQIPVEMYTVFAIRSLLEINLWWSIFNLLPVLPLDGGHICSSLCQMLRLRDPMGMALKVGAVTSGVVAWYMFTRAHQQFMGAMMAMLCIQNISALQSRR